MKQAKMPVSFHCTCGGSIVHTENFSRRRCWVMRMYPSVKSVSERMITMVKATRIMMVTASSEELSPSQR